jgi:hypothetical protein
MWRYCCKSSWHAFVKNCWATLHVAGITNTRMYTGRNWGSASWRIEKSGENILNIWLPNRPTFLSSASSGLAIQSQIWGLVWVCNVKSKYQSVCTWVHRSVLLLAPTASQVRGSGHGSVVADTTLAIVSDLRCSSWMSRHLLREAFVQGP